MTLFFVVRIACQTCCGTRWIPGRGRYTMGTRTYIIFTSDGVAHGTKMEWHTEQSDIEDTVAQMVASIGKKLWHTLPTYGK